MAVCIVKSTSFTRQRPAVQSCHVRFCTGYIEKNERMRVHEARSDGESCSIPVRMLQIGFLYLHVFMIEVSILIKIIDQVRKVRILELRAIVCNAFEPTGQIIRCEAEFPGVVNINE